jgi:hypothetical protein
VGEFWKWYAGEAARFYQIIEDKRCADLAAEISPKVDELVGGLAWVFGPGEGGQGHSLTLTAEGDAHRQLLAAYWQARAPKLDGWTFYSARQPSADPGQGTIRIGEREFDPKAFWLTPSVNEEQKCIDLTAWHPLFPELDESTRWTILYLFLDEALGEIGTQSWIGKITMNDAQLAAALPLAELRAFTEGIATRNDWKKGGPGEVWNLYEMNEEKPEQPRGDIFVGTTSLMALVHDFSDADGEMEDPLAGTGADYVYVQFDAAILQKGQESDARGKIEDGLVAALEPASDGRHIGGAMGRRFAYIDLLLFDGTNSLSIACDALRRMKLPAGTSINYFAHEKRGHRVVL